MGSEVHPDIERVVIPEEEVGRIAARVGAEISRDYAQKNPLIVIVLRGAFVFGSDLIRSISIPLSVDFMAASSYGDSTKSSGVVRIVKDVDTEIEGRDVILVEDILDSGLTLSYLVRMMEARGAASVKVAVFCVKDLVGRTSNVEPSYVGAHVPDEFVVGYGLDYAERYRNLPYVGILKPEAI